MTRTRLVGDDINQVKRHRPGVTLVEVVVVVAILGCVFLVAIFALPRQRETARLNGCRRNLMQIGQALALYDESGSRLPPVPALGPRTGGPGGGPLQVLLGTLGVPDFRDLDDPSSQPNPPPSRAASFGHVRGFVCESDPYAAAASALAPISYRATTGDQPGGVNGAFAPGASLGMTDIEGADGRGYTAAFSERLRGNGRHDDRSPVNYAVVPGPVLGPRCVVEDGASWLGDAGVSWAEVAWRSTLYNHALTPNVAPSCVSRDLATALMGASSGHLPGVNVLIFDGSVRTVGTGVAPQVWRALGTYRTPRQPEP